ncbi:helix-turn-helix transcriptional regulator [Psychrobacillus sp.]|uniref:helix-turn-helix domain-containing protein n=1 Tax=Psychrobacillus sp. TaxID=1871623 RepID=UPI0028BEA94E|nr:helix-turn-helix transcriptional regulator [Psychrobacillus sp.]
MTTFSEKIKQLRISNKMSLEQLSVEFLKRYGAKISKSSISRWENGQAKPDIDDASLYADLFKVSLDSLIDRQPSEKIETIAAHIDEDVTEEEMEEIRRYIEFIKTKRK